MILFHNVVQVGTGSAAAPAAEFPFLLKFCDHLGVRWIAVDCDHSRSGMPGRLQGFWEEMFGRCRVPLSGKPKVDGSASGIHSTIQVPPVPPWQIYVSSTLQEPLVGLILAGIACSVLVRSAGPSAKWWCGLLADPVLPATPRRLDTKARTTDTNGPHKQ